MASPAVGNSRWLAPEIINPPSGVIPTVSKAADIFAFGMVVAEVLTDKLPFEGSSDSGAAYRISKGERPELPQNAEDMGFTTQMRALLQRCWDQNPMERPTIDEVVTTWKGLGEKECVQRTPNHRNHAEFVADGEDLPSESRPTSPSIDTAGQPVPPSKHLLPCLDVASL